ncbi:MAG: SDR family oxidoreductase [Gammaproteobacteria bacterium]|nr:SDR family oxidoreductase [Gammaproteobacteria bacterium]
MFSGSTYFITGSSSGIGASIASMLLENNARVIALGRHVELIKGSDNFFPKRVDFSQLNQLEEMFKRIIKNEKKIDGVICAAGIGRFSALEQFSFEQMQNIMSVNFTAHSLLVRLLLPRLKQQEKSDVLFIGSEAALAGGKNGAMYCASKFAIRGFSQSLREEASKSGVRVSLINPGMVKTPFFDKLNFQPGDEEENFVLPDDVADAAKLVLSARHGTLFEEINMSPLKKVIKFN